MNILDFLKQKNKYIDVINDIFELENKRKQNDTALFKSCFAQFDEI